MIALNNNVSATHKVISDVKPQSGILSEQAAIALCSLGVAVFAIPILVVIQICSGLFWGGMTVYQLLNGSGFNNLDEVWLRSFESYFLICASKKVMPRAKFAQ